MINLSSNYELVEKLVMTFLANFSASVDFVVIDWDVYVLIFYLLYF